VLSGQVPAMFSVVSTSLPHAKAGKLKILAVAASKRSPLVPDVPTISESGYPGFEMGAWAGIVAPKGTPRAIIEKIQVDALKIAHESHFAEKLASAGAQPYPGTTEEFVTLIRRDTEKNGKLIRSLNIKQD
jgi:tripartite-type tricarboxylate transporter receptor subunit TctC